LSKWNKGSSLPLEPPGKAIRTLFFTVDWWLAGVI
jgi:hypothetical protein